jgi:hypothetical protein
LVEIHLAYGSHLREGAAHQCRDKNLVSGGYWSRILPRVSGAFHILYMYNLRHQPYLADSFSSCCDSRGLVCDLLSQ